MAMDQEVVASYLPSLQTTLRDDRSLETASPRQFDPRAGLRRFQFLDQNSESVPRDISTIRADQAELLLLASEKRIGGADVMRGLFGEMEYHRQDSSVFRGEEMRCDSYSLPKYFERGYQKMWRPVTPLLVTLALMFTLVLTSAPSHADGPALFIWLYGPGTAYYASSYSVIGGGHVTDPLGEDVGTVDAQGNIYDNQGNLIGFVTTRA